MAYRGMAPLVFDPGVRVLPFLVLLRELAEKQ